MADKGTQLSIVIRTVDQATAKIKAINASIAEATKPIRDFKSALSDLKSKSGLDDVIGGFKGVGTAIGELLSKVALVGGLAGLAVGGLVHLVDEFDDLGKKAARLGVGVDFLAEMRYAAEKTGVPVEALDSGLQAFNQSLGQVRANTGRMNAFLEKVSPVLLTQLKGAKNNAAAFDILAGAMAKLTDPAKRAALAQKTLGDSALAPLFAKGPKGLKELRDRYLELAGSQEGATEEAEKAGDAMHDLHAATDGIKAALVKGLAPALKVIVERLRDWLVGHREDIARWASEIGEKLPKAVMAVVDAVKSAIEFVTRFVDKIGGWKVAAVGVAAIMAGPLIGAIVTLGSAVVTLGVSLAGLFNLKRVGAFVDMIKLATTKMLGLGAATAEAGAAGGTGRTGGAGKGGGVLGVLPPIAVAMAINEATGGSIQEQAEAKGFKGPSWDWQAALKFLEDEKRSRQLSPSDLIAQSVAAVGSAGAQATQAKVTVDFANAPRGTRITTDPQSTADVDLSVGYQMLGAQ